MSNGSDVIIFSKSRPWQLGQLLRSAINFCDFDKYYIIYKKEPEYHANYQAVVTPFKKRVFLVNEENKILNAFYDAALKCKEYVSIMTDDMVFYDYFSSKNAHKCMRDNKVLSYHFKMNKSYDYCHSVSKKQLVPKNFITFEDNLIWEENDGNWDWFYPFDITGSMYAKKDLLYIISKIYKCMSSGRPIKQPNDIEMVGAEFLFHRGMDVTGKTRMACPINRKCACIPLNHVGSFSFTPNIKSSLESTSYINSNIFAEFNFDLDFFRSYNQKSVHITDFKLIPSATNLF